MCTKTQVLYFTNINSFDAFSLWNELRPLPLPFTLSAAAGKQILNPVDVVKSQWNSGDKSIERDLQTELKVSFEQRTRQLPQGRRIAKVDGVRVRGVGEGGPSGRSLLAWGLRSLLDEVRSEGETGLGQVSEIRLSVTVAIPRMHLELWEW